MWFVRSYPELTSINANRIVKFANQTKSVTPQTATHALPFTVFDKVIVK